MTPRRSSLHLSVWVLTDHAVGARGGARRGVPLTPVDLDQAQPARAERLERVGGAQLGDVDAGQRSPRASPTCRPARSTCDAVDRHRATVGVAGTAGVPKSASGVSRCSAGRGAS